jgi:chromosome segregation ATPase
MVLKALTLENFKGIREPVRIEFEPLTLLFGANNAGKSTIVQALMYAREVLERNNCDAGRTQLGGEVVDLGGWIGRAVSLTPSARMIFSTVSYRGLAPGVNAL